MTPEEVETRIAVPIELEMLGIPQQAHAALDLQVRARPTSPSISRTAPTSTGRASRSASASTGVMGDLPPGVSGRPGADHHAAGRDVHVHHRGRPLSLAEKRALLDWVIRPQLRTVPGVADVNALGGVVRSLRGGARPATRWPRAAWRWTNLQAALEANNRNDGAGRLSDGEEALLVRAEGSVRTLDDVRAIVVAGHATACRCASAMSPRCASARLTRYGAVTQDGEGEAVAGPGARPARRQCAAAWSTACKRELAEIAPTLPKGVTIEPFYDRGDLVERAVGTVAKALARSHRAGGAAAARCSSATCARRWSSR